MTNSSEIMSKLRRIYVAAQNSLGLISDTDYHQWLDVETNYLDQYWRSLAFSTEIRKWSLEHSKRLMGFADIHKGEDCFIIGNGPSLNRMDLSLLQGKYTFGLNKIYLYTRCDLNLSYHVAINQLVIEQSKREYENLRCPSFLSYRYASSVIEPLAHIFYIMTNLQEYCFQPNLLQPIGEGYTVTYAAMQIAYFMGFKRVYLIGVDHSFSFEGQPNDAQILHGSDRNHFASNYFGGMAWHLPDLEGSEAHYRLAKHFFERNNRKIYDATLDGKLTIFDKISYSEALNDACNASGFVWS